MLLKKIRNIRKTSNFIQYNYTKFKIASDSFSWSKQEVKHFIVVCRGRSGSTCFLDLLSSHPQIFTNPHNFFNYDHLPLDFEKTKYLNSHKNIIGFKFLTQTEQNKSNIRLAQEKLNSLAKQGVTIFYLKRNNILNRAISSFVASAKGRKTNYLHDETVPKIKLEISPEEIIHKIKLFEEDARLDREVMANVPHVLIEYERDLENQYSHQNTLNRCCKALEIDSVKARTNFVKLAPKKNESYITNWDEIYNLIASSAYQSYLN